MVKLISVLQWSLLFFVTLWTLPVSAEFTVDVVDPGKGFLSPGTKVDYIITSGDDPTDVDLHLFNLDTNFTSIVAQDIAPQQNGTFVGHFRIALDTPTGPNYTLAIFQQLTESYLAFSLAFEIFPDGPPDPSTPPPSPSSTPTPSGTTRSSSNRPASSTNPHITSASHATAPPLTSSRAVTHSIPHATTILPPSTSSDITTLSSDVATVPSPTSSGRPPLDAGADVEPKAAEIQVNVSAIVGGTVGLVIALGMVIWVLLCWRKHNRRLKGIPQPFPFLIVPPLRIQPPPSTVAEELSPKHETSLYTIPESELGSHIDDSDRQVEFLRRERHRIDTKLAEIERNKYGIGSKRSAISASASSSSLSASSSPSSSSAPPSTPIDLVEELNAMREKVRQLEAARDANPPSFDENSSPQSSSPDSPSPNSKATLRSNSQSLFSPPPDYDPTSPLHGSSHRPPTSKTQCFCRDCG